MKKLLLTCFLALLCLVGRYLAASSRVADSPGAELLHRSDSPNRGGAILPDTFSRNDFGLVDSDQDMGAGEQTYNLNPAPVTVFSSNAIITHRTSDTQHRSFLPSNPSTSQGQEERISSARVGEQFDQAVIWGRVTEYGSRDQIRLQVYPEYFFDSPKAPGANLLFLPLKLGNIMEGAYPKSRSFQYNLQTENEPLWISLSLGESVPFINRFRIDPGDTIQVFLNLESNSLVFSGPSAAKFRLQQDLHRLEEEFQVRTRPVLWTENPDLVLADSTYAVQFEEAKASAGPVLEIKARSLEDLKALEQRDLYESNGLILQSWSLIDSYRNQLSDALLEFFRKEVELREWRKYLLSINSNILYARREGKDHEFLREVIDLSRNKLKGLQPIISSGVSPHSAEMMDLLNAQSRMEAGIAGADRYAYYPIEDQYWNDKLLVRLFYDSFNRIPNGSEYLSSQLEKIQDSRYKNWLETLLELKGTGKLVSGFEFLDEKGALKTFGEIATGELILLEFWISGCKACLAFNENTLTKIKEEFAQDPRVQVVTVSADFTEELWLSSLESGKYTQEEFVNLYTGALNRKHPFLIQYGISSFPNRILLDGKGRIIQASQVPFLASELIPLLKSYLHGTNPKPNTTL